jgi:hypothetical protein
VIYPWNEGFFFLDPEEDATCTTMETRGGKKFRSGET